MKQKPKRELAVRLSAGCLAGCILLVLPAVQAQTIQNPSFEASTFSVAPGYVIENAAIPGWTTSTDTMVGLNPAGGQSPIANNGVVPDGTNVAFLQSAGATLSTDITGLTPGTTYKLMFRANSGTLPTGVSAPLLTILLDFIPLGSVNVYAVGPSNPYMYLAFEFPASAATHNLMLVNDAADVTILLDDFRIAASENRWQTNAWTGDEDSGVDRSYVYTHAYNFSGQDTVINGVPFTGAAGANPHVEGRFTTVSMGNVYNGDANNITFAGTGGSPALATDFVYSASVPPGTYETINLSGLAPGTEYVLTVYSVGWESPTTASRWATFSMGEDRLTLNQDLFDNDNGIRISYRYIADASGTAQFRIAPLNPANVSIHVYGFSNREAVSRNVAPAITTQPRSTTVAAGVPVTFTVAASGFPEPTFRWRRNGTDLPNGNTVEFAIAQALVQDAGNYDVVVANSMGSVTSHVATLTVGLPMTNPSFEADSYVSWPGYSGDNPGNATTPPGQNGPITGWTLSNLNDAGINPISDGSSPFADNGRVPNGKQVAFLQLPRTLSQAVSGLTPGAQYYLHYNENARSVVTLPAVAAKVGDIVVVPEHLVTPVGGSNPYYDIYGAFTAAAATMDVTFTKTSPQGGDSTVLLDNVAIVPIPAGTPPFVSRAPQPQSRTVGQSVTLTGQGIGSLPLSYQWLKNGVMISQATNAELAITSVQETDEADYSFIVSNSSGSVTSIVAHLTVFEPITDLYNTGHDNNRVGLAEGQADPHYVLLTNPDTGTPEAIIEGALPGAWMAHSASSKWIGPQLNTVASAIGHFTYRTTFRLIDRDPKTVMILGQWATDNTGRDILVNGVSITPAPSTSFSAWTPFAIYGTNSNVKAGTNTIDFVVENEAAIGYTGLRVEFLLSNVQTPPGVAPEITTHPAGQTVNEGDNVTFAAVAKGSAPLTYQWSRNGVDLPGETALTLTLTNVTSANAGAYRIRVTNPINSVVSEPANLVVAYRVLPGIVFGTGVDANGQLLPPGAVDPHYILSESADGGNPGPDAFVVNDGWPIQAGVWLLNGPRSKWISVRPEQGTLYAVPGNYTFQTTFDLTGQEVNKVRILGAWAVDNSGVDLLLNGVSVGSLASGFGSFTTFTLAATNGLVAGSNTLDFRVNNGGDTDSPFGLRVDLQAYLELAQVTQPTLQIGVSGETITIQWAPATPGQKLMSATELSGPWQEVSTTSPYTTTAGTGKRFFRVSQ